MQKKYNMATLRLISSKKMENINKTTETENVETIAMDMDYKV